MRPYLALYIGGMGSREKNFYNQLVTRYGYGDAAAEIQDLYLVGQAGGGDGEDPGRPDRQGRALRPEGARSRSASTAYRDAGVGTLLVTPAAATQEERLRMMRDLAEIAA